MSLFGSVTERFSLELVKSEVLASENGVIQSRLSLRERVIDGLYNFFDDLRYSAPAYRARLRRERNNDYYHPDRINL